MNLYIIFLQAIVFTYRSLSRGRVLSKFYELSSFLKMHRSMLGDSICDEYWCKIASLAYQYRCLNNLKSLQGKQENILMFPEKINAFREKLLIWK